MAETKKVLLMGLGNPGLQYDKSRHNAGFCFIDAILNEFPCQKNRQNLQYILWELRHEGIIFYLVKPLTYMNLSGRCLADLQRRTGISLGQICVICDNMDLPLGRVRLKFSGGSAGQKGLQSIINLGGSQDFWRLYIGVGRPIPPQDVPSYVLARFPKEEESLFVSLCQEKAKSFIQGFQKHSFEGLQQILNI